MAKPVVSRRAEILLALGAVLGLGVAALGLLGTPGSSTGGLPSDAVALVNGRPVRTEEFQRAVAAISADRRNPVGEAEKRHALDRLIEEELLVQRALELGFADHDRRVRGDLVSALIQGIVSEASLEEPSRADVETFYEENRDYFTSPGRLRVAQIFVRGNSEEAMARAEAAAERLRSGEGLEALRSELGDREVAPPPDALLPPTKLREYLGPTALRTALELEVGAVSDPVRSSMGLHVLQVVERETSWVPPLDEIEVQVRAEVRRRAGDEALRRYLDELRERGALEVATELP